MSEELAVMLGKQNGDGRDHIQYVFGEKRFPDSLDMASAFQREESIKRAMRFFAAKPDCVPALSQQLAQMAAEHAQTTKRARSAGPVAIYRAMPLDVFPAKLQQYISAVSAAIGCNPSYVAMPLLAALAGCIGNTRRIKIKSSWAEPATIWSLIIAESGQHKSPAMKHVLWALHEWQESAFREYESALVTYHSDLSEYEKNYKGHKAKDGPKPPPPQPPVCERLFASDCTIEALFPLLETRWRGLPVFVDEGTAWFRSFGQYKGGRGGDVGHWLSMADAGPILTDRKTGTKKSFYIRRANVSIATGTQPDTLRLDAAGNITNGLLPRFLLAMPPREKVMWTDREVPEAASRIAQETYARLLSLQPGDSLTGPYPIDLPLTPEAKDLFVSFVNQHGDEQYELTGAMAAVWSKLKAYAARLALTLHLSTWATGDQDVDPNAIDAATVGAAIRLTDWFKGEARRVYAMLEATEEDQDRQRLVEIISKHGEPITARELSKRSRHYADAELAEAALDDLAKTGFGRWETQAPSDQGGRPTRRFILCGAVGETPRKHGGKEVSVTPTAIE